MKVLGGRKKKQKQKQFTSAEEEAEAEAEAKAEDKIYAIVGVIGFALMMILFSKEEMKDFLIGIMLIAFLSLLPIFHYTAASHLYFTNAR